MEDYARLFQFEWNKFLPLETIQGFPHDLQVSLSKIGFTHGYHDDASGHFLLRKTGGSKEQILRQINPGVWITIYPRFKLKMNGDVHERTVVLPL